MKPNEITSDVDEQNGGQLQEDERQQRDRMRRQVLEEAKTKQLEKKKKKAARRKARNKKLPVSASSSDQTSTESSPATSSSSGCCMEQAASSLQAADESMVSSDEFDQHKPLELENGDIFDYIDDQKSEATFTVREKHSMDILSDEGFSVQENICTKQLVSLSDSKTLTEHPEVTDQLLSQSNFDQWLLWYNEVALAKKTKDKEELGDNVTNPKHQGSSMMPDSAEITHDAGKECLKTCLSSISAELVCLKPASVSTLPMCGHCCLIDCNFCGDRHEASPCNSATAEWGGTYQSFSKNTDLDTYNREAAHISKCVHSHQPTETGELSCLRKLQLPRHLSLNSGSIQLTKCLLEIILSHCLSQCSMGVDLLNEDLKYNREIVPYFSSLNLQQSRLQIMLIKLLGEARFSALMGKHYYLNMFRSLPSCPGLKEISYHIVSSQKSGSVKESSAKVSSRFQEPEPERVFEASDDNVDEHVYKDTKNYCQLEASRLEVFQRVQCFQDEIPHTNKEQLMPFWHSFDNSKLNNVDEDAYKCSTDNCQSETSLVKVLQQSPPTTKAQLVPPCNSFENRELAIVDEILQNAEDHSLANVDGTVCKCTTDECQYRNSWKEVITSMQCRNDDSPHVTILHLEPSCNSFEKSGLANIEEVSQNREGCSLANVDKVVLKCTTGKCQSEASWIRGLQYIQCENCECPPITKEHLVPFSHSFDNSELANVDLAVYTCTSCDCQSEKSFQNGQDQSFINVDEMLQKGENSLVNVDEMSQNGENRSLTGADGNADQESCQDRHNHTLDEECVHVEDSFSKRNVASDLWCPFRQEFVPDNWDDEAQLVPSCNSFEKSKLANVDGVSQNGQDHSFINVDEMSQKGDGCSLVNADGMSQKGENSLVNIDELSQKGENSFVNVDGMAENGKCHSLLNIDELLQNRENQSLTGADGNAEPESCHDKHNHTFDEECDRGKDSFSKRNVVSDLWCPFRQEFVPDNWDDEAQLVPSCNSFEKSKLANVDGVSQNGQDHSFINVDEMSQKRDRCSLVNVDEMSQNGEYNSLVNVDGMFQNRENSLVNVDEMLLNVENSLVNVGEMSQKRDGCSLVNVDVMLLKGENSLVNVDEMSQNGENQSLTGADGNADPESCQDRHNQTLYEECDHGKDSFSEENVASDLWCPIRQEFVPDNWDDEAQLVPSCNSFEKSKLANVDGMSQNGQDHSFINVDEMSQKRDSCSLVNVDEMLLNVENSLVNVDEMLLNVENSLVNVDEMLLKGENSLVNVDEMSQNGENQSLTGADGNADPKSCQDRHNHTLDEECDHGKDSFSEENVASDLWCPIRQEFIPDNWDDDLLSDEDLSGLTSICVNADDRISPPASNREFVAETGTECQQHCQQNISCQEMVKNMIIFCDNKNSQRHVKDMIPNVGEDDSGGHCGGNDMVKFSEATAPLYQTKPVMKMQQRGTAKYQHTDHKLLLKPNITLHQSTGLGPFTEAESNISKVKLWSTVVSNQSQTQRLHNEPFTHRDAERKKSNEKEWPALVSDQSQTQRLHNEPFTHREAERKKSNEKEWPALVSDQSQTQRLHNELFTHREAEKNKSNEKVWPIHVSDHSLLQRLQTAGLVTHTEEERNQGNEKVWPTLVCNQSQPQRLQTDLLTHTEAETNTRNEKVWPTHVSDQSQTQRLQTDLLTHTEAETNTRNEKVWPTHVSDQSQTQRLQTDLLTHTEAERKKDNEKVWPTLVCNQSQPQRLQTDLLTHTEAETNTRNEKVWLTHVSDQSQTQRLQTDLLTHTEAETNTRNEKVWLTHVSDQSQTQRLQTERLTHTEAERNKSDETHVVSNQSPPQKLCTELLTNTEAETNKSDEKVWTTHVSDQSQTQRLQTERLTNTEAETNKSDEKVWTTHVSDQSQTQRLQTERLTNTEAETNKSDEKVWTTHVSDQSQTQRLQTELLTDQLHQLNVETEIEQRREQYELTSDLNKISRALQNSTDKNNITESGMIKAPELNVSDNLLVSLVRNIPADFLNLKEARVLNYDKDELSYRTDIVENNLFSKNLTNTRAVVNSGKDCSFHNMEGACELDHTVYKKLEWIPESVLKLGTAETSMDHVITGYTLQQKEFPLDYLTTGNSDNVTYVESCANKQIYSGLPVNNEATVHMKSNINIPPGISHTMQPLAHPPPAPVASNNWCLSPTRADLDNLIALTVQKEKERLYLLLCDLQAKVVALMKTFNARKSSLAGLNDIADFKNIRSLPGDKELSLEEIETIIDRFVPVVNKCGMSAPEHTSTKSVPQNKHGENSQNSIPLQCDKEEKGLGQRELSDAELDNILKRLRMLDVNDMKSPQTRGHNTSHSINGSCHDRSLNGNRCFQDPQLQSSLKCPPDCDQMSWVGKTNKLQTPLFQNKTNKTVSTCKVEADEFFKYPDISNRNSTDSWGLQELHRHLMRTQPQSGNLTMSRAKEESFSMMNSLCKSSEEYQTNLPEHDKSKVLYKFFRRRKVNIPENSLSERENREIEFSNLHSFGFPTEVGHHLPTSKEASRSFSVSASAFPVLRKVLQTTESSQFNYCLPSKSQRPVLTVSKTLPKKTGESYTKDNWRSRQK